MLKRVLPHICIIISSMMIVLLVLNKINDAMGFLKGSVFEVLLSVYIVATLVLSIITLTVNRKK